MLRKQNWQVFVIKGGRGGGFRETFRVSDLGNWWMVVIFIWQGRERQNCGERGLVLDTQESPVGNSNVESGESSGLDVHRWESLEYWFNWSHRFEWDYSERIYRIRSGQEIGPWGISMSEINRRIGHCKGRREIKKDIRKPRGNKGRI